MKLNFRYQIRVLLFLLLALTTFSCGKESSCFKGTGKIEKEQRTITSDISISNIEDNIDLVLTQSVDASIFVEGGKNLLPYINTDVSGSEINISSDNKCSLLRDYNIPITVYLSLPNLTKLNYTGQGIVSSGNTLNLSNFEFETSKGTGSINLNMNAEKIEECMHVVTTEMHEMRMHSNH